MSDVLNDDIQVPACIGTAKVHQEIYIETAKLADAEGLTLDVKNQCHWHIFGKGVRVNYYPFSKNRTAHVDGTWNGVMHCTPWDAVQLALKQPDPKQVQRKWKKPGPKQVVQVPTPDIEHQPTTGRPPWE